MNAWQWVVARTPGPTRRVISRVTDGVIMLVVVLGVFMLACTHFAHRLFPVQARADAGRVVLHGRAGVVPWPALADEVSRLVGASLLHTDHPVRVILVPRWFLAVANPFAYLIEAVGITPFNGLSMVLEPADAERLESNKSLDNVIAHEVAHTDLNVRYGDPVPLWQHIPGMSMWQMEGLCEHAASATAVTLPQMREILFRMRDNQPLEYEDGYRLFQAAVEQALREGQSMEQILASEEAFMVLVTRSVRHHVDALALK